MNEKKAVLNGLTAVEMEVVQQLRRQPEMMGRVQHILAIANSTEGPLKTADEVEEVLIEEMRKLGNAALTGWAEQAQRRSSEKLQTEDRTAFKRKKKG